VCKKEIVSNFFKKVLDFPRIFLYTIRIESKREKIMNEENNREETFTFGPFEVTVHPATNEEDEWVEVCDS